MEERESRDTTPQVNPGYAAFQVAKALTTSEEHADAETRERARQKVAKWSTVLNGVLSGDLDVGSRTPVPDAPAWATLEVVTGGFATGDLLAAGPLQAHEKALLDQLEPPDESAPRRLLNSFFLSEDGFSHLTEQLQSGAYDVAVPEEGAFLVAAWLTQNGHAEAARALLEEIAPFFEKLRFYPIPTGQPRRFGSRVFVQDVGATIEALKRIGPNESILAQKEAIQVWAPLYDRAVRLFLETVEGDLPRLQNGRVAPSGEQNPIAGGWPCQRYPDGWPARAQQVLDEYRETRSLQKRCGKPENPNGSFAPLRKYLRRCIADPKALTGRDVGRVRLILARYISKRGAPDSAEWEAARARQRTQAGAPTYHELAPIVLQRLEQLPRDSGLDDVAPILADVAADEAERFDIAEGTPVPAPQHRKVLRSLCETVESLVERGIVTSADTLARVLPQMTSGLRAAGITDPDLRRLYAALYRAFRLRRSLLLLNLESQVKIEELPWVAAIDRFRRSDLSSRELARQTLEDVTALTLTSFPHAIIPNKLIQELRALVKDAGLSLPLVDEVAADIFMGEFSPKFTQSAKRAAELLTGTLYETYYGIDYDRVQALPESEPKPRRWFRPVANSDSLIEVCQSIAGVKYGAWKVAINGMLIEQQQIITTQNFAALLSGLGLVDGLRSRLEELARRCFEWICARQQVKTPDRHSRLIVLKNTAYAWRQMVFYLALLPNEQVAAFTGWADDHLKKQTNSFQLRFVPALTGLKLAAEGRSPDDAAARSEGSRRFLGWTQGDHWLMDSANAGRS